MAAGDFVQVVGAGTIAGSNTTAIAITVPALGCANGNTLLSVFGAVTVLVGGITNSTGSDPWNLNDESIAGGGGNTSVSVSSCQLNSALASGATISATPASADTGKNFVVVEFEGHLTLDSGAIGTADSGATNKTAQTVTAAGATAQARNVAFLGCCFSTTTYVDGSAAASGWTFPAGASKQNSSGTTKDATALYREITSIETPSAALTWTGSVKMVAALATYQVPCGGGGGGPTLHELLMMGVGL